jgi:hypothetical protein
MKVSTKKHSDCTIRRVKLICNLIIDTSSVNITGIVLGESTNCEALIYVIISISLLFDLS